MPGKEQFIFTFGPSITASLFVYSLCIGQRIKIADYDAGELDSSGGFILYLCQVSPLTAPRQ